MGVDREGRVLVEKHRLGREAAREGEQKVSGTDSLALHAPVQGLTKSCCRPPLGAGRPQHETKADKPSNVATLGLLKPLKI